MLKPTDKQLKEIGSTLGWAEPYALEQGKRALVACGAFLLQEPKGEEWADAAYGVNADECECRRDRDGKVFLSAYAVKQMLQSRLKALTEPEIDPAVEALHDLEIPVGLSLFEASTASPRQKFTWVFAKQIVAAVRKADKEASNA